MRQVHAYSPDAGDRRHPPTPGQIASEIELTGSACLVGTVPQQWLDAVRRYVDGVSADVHEVMLEGADASALPFLHELTTDPELLALLDSVTQAARPARDAARPDIECALRVINGADTTDHPLWFHYDASMLTVVLPIDIPDAGPGRSGELILCPGHRPYRRWALTNVIEKAVTQSDRYRRRFARQLNWNRDTELVPLKPGNAYLFWGYRSYHATMPIEPGSRRVTVILHYRDVHAQSRIVKYAKALRNGIAGLGAE